MGLPFFEKAVDLMGRFGRNQAVGNGLQTNGLLIDKNWTFFLRQYNFLMGLSLDGPEHIHDRYRLTGGGKGTCRTVMDRAKLMLDAGLAVNALSVVTDYAADFPEETYEFLKGIGLFHMQFIPCVEFDPQTPELPLPYSVSPEKFGGFLCKVFDLWINDFDKGRPTTSIRFFDSIFYRYVDMTPPECSLLEKCGNYLVVEHTGDVYSCDFFVEPKWHLGNIHKDRLDRIQNSRKQYTFGAMKSDLSPQCTGCRWLAYCNRGCPRNRPIPDKGLHPDHLCIAYKRFFDHADTKLKELAAAWASEISSVN
jgi:uncharacterized protein